MHSDLRSAWRAIWKSPATSIGAMLALALGIGATTTIFGLLNAVLLRPLPYPEADRLVEIWGNVQRQVVERRGASFKDYEDWRDQTTSFDAMAAWSGGSFIVYGGGEPDLVNAEIVDGPYFELLGVHPIQGRLFQSTDFRRDAAPVVVIGERLWEQRFNRDPGAVGRGMQLDSRIFTIAGVVPARFGGRSDQAEVWTPLATTFPAGSLDGRGNRSFPVLARLKAGVPRDAAQADIAAVCAQLEQTYRETNDKRSAEVSPLAVEIFGTLAPAVQLLFGVVALVLLIACCNVAGLLLARNEARRREMSLRRALGAGDRQLVRLLLAESALLVLIGGTFGWILAQWTSDVLLALSPVQLPSFAAPAVDWRTVTFVSIIGVLTTAAIGLTPLTSFGGESLAQSLREGAIASRGGGRLSPLRFIIVGEMAVAVALLVGAALLGRSFAALLAFDPGFDSTGVLALRIQLPLAPAGSTALPQGPPPLALLEELHAVPGIRNAALATRIPLSGTGAIFYSAEGMPPVDATNRPRIYIQGVTPGYFDTLDIEFVEGRDFTLAEMGSASTAVIVSENVTKRFWPGESAIGRRIKQGDLASQAPWLTIIGVVRETNLRGIPRNPTADPDLYSPVREQSRVFSALLKTDGDPSRLAGPARAALMRVAPGLAVYNVQPLQELVDRQLAPARFLSWLTGVFAGVALTLVIIGIYGTLAYWVRRRSAEIGIRSALGADRRRLLGLVLGQALVMTAIGLVLGMLLAVGLGRFVQSQLFAVQAIDWVSFAGTAGVMLVAAMLASLGPALRALRVDPITALRSSA